MKNIEPDVPADFNAMIVRIKNKYPYLDGWYSSMGSAAIIFEETDKLGNLDRYLESLSISKEENPFGNYKFDIIDNNKYIANLKYYKYCGSHNIKFLEEIDGEKLTIDEMEKQIEKVMSIIEDKKRELKEMEVKEKLEKMNKDF